jgi:hypothetical protein
MCIYICVRERARVIWFFFSVVISRHGTVTNAIYKHHPTLGVYGIKIRSVCLAAYTVICDGRLYPGRFIMCTVITNIYNKKTPKRLRRTLRTVVFDMDSSLAAVPFDFFGLYRKLARTCSTSSSAVNGRPFYFCLHRHPVCTLREMHVTQ